MFGPTLRILACRFCVSAPGAGRRKKSQPSRPRLFPALWIGYRIFDDDLGPRPLNELTHETGSWTVRLLLLALAISPARRIFSAPRLILARRTLGVAACFYILAHLGLYIYDQHFDLLVVVREIVLRFYLLIGAIGLLGMVALAATSWDGAVRKLGAVRWNRLHRLVSSDRRTRDRPFRAASQAQGV